MARERAGGAVKGFRLALVLASGCAVWAAHERHRWSQVLLALWVETAHDVPYGPQPDNRLDILRRRWRAGSDHPGVVVFHGGGWARGSRPGGGFGIATEIPLLDRPVIRAVLLRADYPRCSRFTVRRTKSSRPGRLPG